jgi:uncharacterized membrane protein YfcA
MQYKYAMERILNPGGLTPPTSKILDSQSCDPDVSCSIIEAQIEVGKGTHPSKQYPFWVEVIKENSSDILNFFIPLGWCLLFVSIMNRDSFLSTIYMPFLGIFAATLANTVPIGGGIVYVPALLLLGVDMKLGVSFTVATMSFGNGCFGFFRWLQKDPELFIWESFWYTIIPSWIGSILGIFFLPELSTEYVKILFASVCVKVSIIVALAAWKGGIDKLNFIPTSCDFTSSTPTRQLNSASPLSSSCIYTLVIITFLGGVFLVPNIGIGPALTTYLILNYFGYSTHSSVVTGIITGGWVCVLPFVIHIIYLQDVPYDLWLMVIPGVYLGAMVCDQLFPFVSLPIFPHSSSSLSFS